MAHPPPKFKMKVGGNNLKLGKYPNLAAEVEAQAMREIEFSWLAGDVGVTVRLLREIIWGNEEPTMSEALALFRWLSQNRGYDHYYMDYLFAPVLATVPPGTNKTRYRIVTLRGLLDAADSLSPAHWWRDDRARARRTLDRMEQGETVTYAEYRAGVTLANHIIADRVQTLQMHPRDLGDMLDDAG